MQNYYTLILLISDVQYSDIYMKLIALHQTCFEQLNVFHSNL